MQNNNSIIIKEYMAMRYLNTRRLDTYYYSPLLIILLEQNKAVSAKRSK
jgi:hypothetical protein